MLFARHVPSALAVPESAEARNHSYLGCVLHLLERCHLGGCTAVAQMQE